MTEIEVMNKKQQRKLAVDRRRALTQDERDEKSRVICDILTRLIKEPRYSEVRTIFSYRGTWDEVNVDAFNDWAEVQGYRVAYPISLPKGIMKAAVPAEENAWHRDRFMTCMSPESLIMVAFEAQRLEKLITEETDIPVPTIVTETGITRIS